MIQLKLNSHICGIKTGIINIHSEESFIKSLLEQNYRHNFCQVVPLNKVCSRFQVFVALESAIEAIKNKSAFSKKLELEFLIRFFGTKQISKTFKYAKLKKGNNNVLLICAQKNQKALLKLFKKIENVSEFKEKKIVIGSNKKELSDFYGISKKELKTLKYLNNPLEAAIIEKNALVVFEN